MSKNKIDIGSKMNFQNLGKDYSLKDKKQKEKSIDKIVRIDLDKLEESPSDWNFYPPLADDEFEKLVYSILENGLIHPIVVRNDENKNIILSGHNRVRAFKQILAEIDKKTQGKKTTFDLPSNINKNDYLQIMCVLKEDISDEDAKEIIIDANYVQRKLSQKLITKSIIEKYKIVKKRRSDDVSYKNKKTRDIVAEEFKLSGRHVDRYKKLEKLDWQILELFYDGKISLDVASKIALLSQKNQKFIAKNYIDSLVKNQSKVVNFLKSSLNESDIKAIFEEKILPDDKVVFSITKGGIKRNIEIKDTKLQKKIFDLLGIEQ